MVEHSSRPAPLAILAELRQGLAMDRPGQQARLTMNADQVAQMIGAIEAGPDAQLLAAISRCAIVFRQHQHHHARKAGKAWFPWVRNSRLAKARANGEEADAARRRDPRRARVRRQRPGRRSWLIPGPWVRS